MCRVRHQPEAGLYGDCMRACVASIMDIANPEDVPHFAHDGCDGETAHARMQEYVSSLGFACFSIGTGLDREALMAEMALQPDFHYMLFGATHAGNHVVVCRGGEVVHDPAWSRSPMVGPGSSGVWSIVVFVRK